MFLPDHAFEVMGAPLSGENLIAHEGKSNRTKYWKVAAGPGTLFAANRSVNYKEEAQKRIRRALSSALRVFRRGCFVPDLTRLAELLCEGTRRTAHCSEKAARAKERRAAFC